MVKTKMCKTKEKVALILLLCQVFGHSSSCQSCWFKSICFRGWRTAQEEQQRRRRGAEEPLGFLTFCVLKPPQTQTEVKTTFPKHHFRIIADTRYFRDNSPCIDYFAKHCISFSCSLYCVQNYPQLVISSPATLVS